MPNTDISQTQDFSSALVKLGLNAVVITADSDHPKVLIVDSKELGLGDGFEEDGLPSGPLDPQKDRTLNLGLRRWIYELAGLSVGYIEQLYTFGNKFRDLREAQGGARYLSVSYFGLMQEKQPKEGVSASWRNIYDFLPWEDWREGRPSRFMDLILSALEQWSIEASSPEEMRQRKARVRMTFGDESGGFDHEKVLQRFELLYDAGLVPEAHRDYSLIKDNNLGQLKISRDLEARPELKEIADKISPVSLAMDHRRILASALERVRGKLKYRPLVFEILPSNFTLYYLQQTVEALSGIRLHKQNFRRLIQNEKLVEETGEMDTSSRGRPAALFRFREQVLYERPAPGVGLPKTK